MVFLVGVLVMPIRPRRIASGLKMDLIRFLYTIEWIWWGNILLVPLAKLRNFLLDYCFRLYNRRTEEVHAVGSHFCTHRKSHNAK